MVWLTQDRIYLKATEKSDEMSQTGNKRIQSWLQQAGTQTL